MPRSTCHSSAVGDENYFSKGGTKRRRRRVKLSTLYAELTDEELRRAGRNGEEEARDERKSTCLPKNRVRLYIPLGGTSTVSGGCSFYVATVDHSVTGHELVNFMCKQLQLEGERRMTVQLKMQLARNREWQDLCLEDEPILVLKALSEEGAQEGEYPRLFFLY